MIMGIFLTYLLIVPYITVLIYFFIYKKDNFFLKIRSSVQLLLILILLGLSFVNVLIWKGFFESYTFLGFDIENKPDQFKTTALVTVLAAIAAVFGWIFTSRVQIINTTRSHSVQVLMNSRNSTVYMDKVDKATIIRRRLSEEQSLSNKDTCFIFNEKISTVYKMKNVIGKNKAEKIQLSESAYQKLDHAEKSAVTYLLNFLEFVAIGVRHNNLDEDLIRGSFKSILKSNYVLFEPVIEHLRKLDSPKTYMQLEMLHKRWDDEKHLKCHKCSEWHQVGIDNSKLTKLKVITRHVVFTLFTCFFWLILLSVMKYIEWLTISREEDNFICVDCEMDALKSKVT